MHGEPKCNGGFTHCVSGTFKKWFNFDEIVSMKKTEWKLKSKFQCMSFHRFDIRSQNSDPRRNAKVFSIYLAFLHKSFSNKLTLIMRSWIGTLRCLTTTSTTGTSSEPTLIQRNRISFVPRHKMFINYHSAILDCTILTCMYT